MLLIRLGILSYFTGALLHDPFNSPPFHTSSCSTQNSHKAIQRFKKFLHLTRITWKLTPILKWRKKKTVQSLCKPACIGLCVKTCNCCSMFTILFFHFLHFETNRKKPWYYSVLLVFFFFKQSFSNVEKISATQGTNKLLLIQLNS